MNIDKKRIPKELDRRRKLTDEDKKDIFKLFNVEGLGIREIARRYQALVCRRTIQFILFPERRVKMASTHDSKKYYNKDKWKETMRDHRAYKRSIINKLV